MQWNSQEEHYTVYIYVMQRTVTLYNKGANYILKWSLVNAWLVSKYMIWCRINLEFLFVTMNLWSTHWDLSDLFTLNNDFITVNSLLLQTITDLPWNCLVSMNLHLIPLISKNCKKTSHFTCHFTCYMSKISSYVLKNQKHIYMSTSITFQKKPQRPPTKKLWRSKCEVMTWIKWAGHYSVVINGNSSYFLQ